MDTIISIEKTHTSLDIHIIITDLDLTKIHTCRTDSIRNQNDISLIINSVLERDFKTIINFFKERYRLQHCGITLSLGPTFRRKIIEKRNCCAYEEI